MYRLANGVPDNALPATDPLFSKAILPGVFDQYGFDYSIPRAANSDEEITKPNHIMPSAGMFGSMPSLSRDLIPWTTFLFRPEMNPDRLPHIGAVGRSREGSGSNGFGQRDDRSFPPDHMLLEYFWTPVIQPYAISEPYATAGKVGMNYRMAPFTPIKRATWLHAVLKSERLLSIPTSAGPSYKTDSAASGSTGWCNPLMLIRPYYNGKIDLTRGTTFKVHQNYAKCF